MTLYYQTNTKSYGKFHNFGKFCLDDNRRSRFGQLETMQFRSLAVKGRTIPANIAKRQTRSMASSGGKKTDAALLAGMPKIKIIIFYKNNRDLKLYQ